MQLTALLTKYTMFILELQGLPLPLGTHTHTHTFSESLSCISLSDLILVESIYRQLRISLQRDTGWRKTLETWNTGKRLISTGQLQYLEEMCLFQNVIKPLHLLFSVQATKQRGRIHAPGRLCLSFSKKTGALLPLKGCVTSYMLYCCDLTHFIYRYSTSPDMGFVLYQGKEDNEQAESLD